jgi:uncharacterized protein YjdB
MASKGSLTPFVTLNRSAQLYNTVGYPSGGNIGSTNNATFVATWSGTSNTVINAVYVISGQILPGMSLSAVGIAPGTYIVGPYTPNTIGPGGLGQYVISVPTIGANSPINIKTGTYGPAPGSLVSATSFPQNYPQGPGGIVGPIPGFNCVDIMDIRDYYNLPYPPATPLSSPPIIAVVSFGGGIYGQPITTGQYAGFWRCTDISGSNGTPIQILVAPINGAINAPNADDGGATLENTVDVATVNAFYGMIDPRRDAPIYTPPIIILYIAPSSDISEMYRTFYTVLKNPVACNGKSYLPSIVTCSWGAPEIAWTQKMAFPPNPSIPVDNDPNPAGIAELNEINDLFAEATKNGINICCATGDIPLTTVNNSISQYNYAQALLLQGSDGPGYPTTDESPPIPAVFPLTPAARASLPAPQVMFPASSPYVTSVGGSAVYFPTINTGSYDNPAEFAWARGNGGISSVFTIPSYQQNLPGSAATSAAQFLASSLNAANLAQAALGTPSPNGGNIFPDPITGGITAPNTAVTLATQTKGLAYDNTLSVFNAAVEALQAAQASAMDDALSNSLIKTVKDASTTLATAKASKELAEEALKKAQEHVVKTQTVSNLLVTAGIIFGASAAVSGANYEQGAAYTTQQALLDAQLAAQQAAYTQLITPNTTNSIALQQANDTLRAATSAAAETGLAAMTLPAAVQDTTNVAVRAVDQAAAAIIAPSFSTHPYFMFEPVDSTLVPISNMAYDSAHVVAERLPHDSSATTAPPYLITNLGIGYLAIVDPKGVAIESLRGLMNTGITKSDELIDQLVNTAVDYDSSGNEIPPTNSELTLITNDSIVSAVGQIDSGGGDYDSELEEWVLLGRVGSNNVMMPAVGTSLTAPLFAAAAVNLAKGGSALISAYESGGVDSSEDTAGVGLRCGIASAAGCALAAVFPVTQDELTADIEENPFGITIDIYGNNTSSRAYTGITPPLINLRNIYANTTLMTRRTSTAVKAAKNSKEAFLAWHSANEQVIQLSSQASALYNSVPTPSSRLVLEMDAKLLNAKTKLSSATYALAVAENYAVITARLAQQSATSTSVFMGNLISDSYDQLGNLNSVDSSYDTTTRGGNNSNCPLLAFFGADGTQSANSLRAAQALAEAAANDTYLTTSISTIGNYGINGMDGSSNASVTLTGTKLLVQDAQYAAAGASAQVANVAFADASESLARFTDWHNVCIAANTANESSAAVYRSLQDASGNTATTRTNLIEAVNAITATVTNLLAAITPYNQQATTSATIATNNVVVLAAKLENAKNICVAAQTAIQLAASTYSTDSVGTIISGIPNGQGGSIFTVNMAYAKVCADAAVAVCSAAAILAREEAVLAARRANYSALALKKLVGESVLGKAIAGFLDASGNLVSQTGYGKASPTGAVNEFPLRKAPGYNGTNGYKPPAVVAPTILYQGQGGLNLDSASIDASMNTQPSIITNLAYTVSLYSDVYSATSGLVSAAQAALDALDSDASGNSAPITARELVYPNVNAVNALNSSIGQTNGAGLIAVQNCLLAAYEAQQWVIASANATFVTFGYSSQNVNLVSFTPSLIGVINKLASDAEACLDTVLTAESAILYAMTQRLPSSRLLLHDVDAGNFAAVFNANQSAADTYMELTSAAKIHNVNARMTLHLGDLTNAISPCAANLTTAAARAAALGGMVFSAPTPNPNLPSTNALKNANFPNTFTNTNENFAVGGWGSASLPVIGFGVVEQTNNSTNPNPGPYNGTATGAAPFPAPNASSTNRTPAPAAQVLHIASQLLNLQLSNLALSTSKVAVSCLKTITNFNNLMVQVSTVTPSLVDAATSASNLTLKAAQLANYATSLETQGNTWPNQVSRNTSANLLAKEFEAVLAAAQSAKANLQATSLTDPRYLSRQNMLNLWNIAVDAASAAVAASDGGPTNFPDGTDPNNIVAASLGSTAIMGTTTGNSWSGTLLAGNSAPYYYINVAGVAKGTMETVVYTTPDTTSTSVSQPSLLALLNAAVINAYNATTGAPTPGSPSNYTYIQFLNGTNVISNFPENVNDTEQAYNNAIDALKANLAVGKPSVAAVEAAALRIRAAYEAAQEVAAAPPALVIPTAIQARVTTDIESVSGPTGLTSQQAASQIAMAFWNNANQFATSMLSEDSSGTSAYPNLTLGNVFELMAIVGINFTDIIPENTSAAALSYANAANLKHEAIINDWSRGLAATWDVDGSGNPAYGPTGGLSLSTDAATTLSAIGLGRYKDASNNPVLEDGAGDFLSRAGIAQGLVDTTTPTPVDWSAYFWTKAISDPNNQLSGIALRTATEAWNAVATLLNTFITSPSLLDFNASTATRAKARAIYSVKIALQSSSRANISGQESATASNALATATNSYEDLAAFAAAEAAYAATANLNMYRCLPDIAMHANADDLPVIFKLNGSSVYVGGTAIAAAMFAGFLGVVQSRNPINYFVNPLLYDNYTFPSPLFNDISGSLQVWNSISVGGATVPPRIANILPGLQNPTSGLGSGIYNLNVGLGSIKGMNLSALMGVPNLVTNVTPEFGPSSSTTVYPGTSSIIRVFVEPVTAYNPFVKWSCNSPNAVVSQTNDPELSNNGSNDTNPYTTYNPLLHDASGNSLEPDSSIGNYALGSVGNARVGTNPFNNDSPCIIFSATVTGITAVPTSAPLPIITITSTDGSAVYGNYTVVVLPAIQVTGVSISLESRISNPANTTLFLGSMLQLVANVTPLNATNKRVFWWSSNTSVVNVDASGLLTSLAPGNVTIKATSINNNISASISVYVPTPITGLDVLPKSITLNPNMLVYPLRNSGQIRAVVQPENADYKNLTWEVISSTQSLPAPTGISDVISLPRNGTILARDTNGNITDNTLATVTAVSNGTVLIKVSTSGEPYGVFGTYSSMVTVNVVTPVTDIVMTKNDMVINLNPHNSQYDGSRSLPESYQLTATFKPAYPSNMNVFWSSSNPKVAVVSNNSSPVLNTTVSDPDFGLMQITEVITPLSNGTAVIKVTTADGQKTSMATIVVTTPVSGLAISPQPVILNPSRSYNIQATVLPATATNKTIVWKSTNTAVATVDGNGLVTAITSGSCGISATTVDGDFTGITEVSVFTPLVGVQLLVNTPLPIHINDVVQILVVMVPTTASNQLFSWTITDGANGPIFCTGPQQNGNVVFLDAVQSGNSIFTVTTADGNKQASINLQVVNW